MTGSDAAINDQDLEILLQQSDSCDNSADALPDLTQHSANVTIRGELDKISLSDIFQTLSMSKMEGVLSIHRSLETRLIHFDETGVRLLNANRSRTRKLGQRLVQSGLISSTDLRSALLYQKKEQKPLGQILVGQGILDPDALQKALENQIEEDLYSLFTWESGAFEFYKGVTDEPAVQAAVKNAPSFAINFVLLEVARRADEWRLILRDIGSVHEVPIFVPDVELPEMSGDNLLVCEAIDEMSTIRDLGDSTMLGLFTAAKAVADLLHADLIEFAAAPMLLSLARDAASRGETDRAVQMAHTIQERSHEIDHDLVAALADVLEQCREPRISAEILFSCARSLNDPESRLAAAQLALNFERHHGALLRFTAEQYEALDLTDEEGYLDVVESLCTELAESGEFDTALEYLEELESRTPNDVQLLTRKAKLLQAAGREEDALEILNQVREVAESGGDRQRLIKVYEQILKIDPNNRGVQKALRDQRGGRARVIRRRIIAGSVCAVVAAAGWAAWAMAKNAERMEAIKVEIQNALAKRDTGKAGSLLANAVGEYGEGDHWRDLKKEIDAVIATVRNERRGKEEKQVRAILDEAAKVLEKGDYASALKTYEAQLARKFEFKGTKKLIQTVAKGQLLAAIKPFRTDAAKLTEDVPGPVPDVGTIDDYRDAADVLKDKLEFDVSRAAAFTAVSANPLLKKLLTKRELEDSALHAKTLVDTRATIEARSKDYATRIVKLEKNERLDPVFAEARRAEEKFDFRAAEQLFRELHQEYRSSKTLEPRFRAKVAKYSAINEELRVLVAASKRNDFQRARDSYRKLRSKYKHVPWGHLIKLPVHIETTPPKAVVTLNGKVMGNTPIILRYFPSVRGTVELSRKGFRTETSSLHGDTTGRIRRLLTLAPRWRIKTKGAVDKAPASDASRIYMVDRSGAVLAWSHRTRKRAWKRDIGDLSGLLTRPVLYKSSVLVGSLDGPLRSLDRSTGEIAWQVENLPTESTPVRVDNKLYIATKKGNLTCVNLDAKKVMWDLDLGSETKLDLQLVDQTFLVVVLNDGTLRCINVDDQSDRWAPITLPPGMPAQPLLHRQAIVVGTDEGHLNAYDLTNGKLLWKKSDLGELRWQPAPVGRGVLVTAIETLSTPARALTFDLRSGKPGPGYEPPEGTAWAGPPVTIGSHVLVGDRSGTITVLHRNDLRVRFRIQGRGAPRAPTTVLSTGEPISSFDGKELLVLPPLR